MKGILKNKGSFGKKLIYYKYIACKKKSNDYFIFFHGSFGSSCNSEKYDLIAKKILNFKLGNVFLYETSRNVYTHESKLPYSEYKKVFGNKSYRQELEDVTTVFHFFFNKIVKNNKKAKLHFIGFSLGGIQSLYLLPVYSVYVKSVFLFGSGKTINSSDTYKGYPAYESILKNLNQFAGSVVIIQGTKDSVVSEKEAEILFNAAMKAEIVFRIKLKGVDHSFRTLNGKQEAVKITQSIFNIINFVHAEN